jgi:hypothetical protein
MWLLVSIILTGFIAFLIFIISPHVAGFIGFGVVTGSLLRLVYLVNQINNRMIKQDEGNKSEEI